MDDLPEPILEEAAVWQARLREPGLPAAERDALWASFNAWLSRDARHRQAFEQMQALWGPLEDPVKQCLDAQTPTPGHFSSPRPPARETWAQRALAACLVLALVGGVGWQQDWVTQWRGDYLTGVGQTRPWQLDDGSRITLNADSALAQDYTSEQRQVRLLKGEAWFDIAPADARPFIVATPLGRVRVTGTQFNLRLSQDKAIVSLAEGELVLSSGAGDPEARVMLSPGQQAELSPQGITAPEAFDRTAVTAWLRGQFVFYDTPLAQVVATLNRHRPGRILIVDTALNELKVSGVFSIERPDAALEVITNTLPVQQTRLTDYLVLLR